MARRCTVCAHPNAADINEQLLNQVPMESLAKAHGLTIAALHRHRQHVPQQLIKAQDAKEIAAADSLMGKVFALDRKAEDVYARAIEADNLTAAIQAVRELRGLTELYAKITGEIQQQTVNNIVIMPEWVSLRYAILAALEPYPDARQAVISAIGGDGK